MSKLPTYLIILLLMISCEEVSSPPSVHLVCFPSFGDTTTLYELNAADSHDDRCYEIALRYRWDFDGDFHWDTEYSSENIVVKHFPQPGDYMVSVEVINPEGLTAIATDTITSFGRNKDCSQLIDPRDGQTYRTVKLMDRWWMAENLRYGQKISISEEQTNNQIVERYELTDTVYRNSTNCFYSWFEVMNYEKTDLQGICPDGWHIPSESEWLSLYSSFPSTYRAIYYGEDGLSGFNLHDGGHLFKFKDFPEYEPYSLDSGFWSSSSHIDAENKIRAAQLVFYRGMAVSHVEVSPGFYNSEGWQVYNTIRCIKDYN